MDPSSRRLSHSALGSLVSGVKESATMWAAACAPLATAFHFEPTAAAVLTAEARAATVSALALEAAADALAALRLRNVSQRSMSLARASTAMAVLPRPVCTLRTRPVAAACSPTLKRQQSSFRSPSVDLAICHRHTAPTSCACRIMRNDKANRVRSKRLRSTCSASLLLCCGCPRCFARDPTLRPAASRCESS